RIDHPRLTDGVLAPQERIGSAPNSVAEVLELEPIRVDRLDLDPLHPGVATKLDHRLDAVPWIVEEERPIAPDRLELVTFGQGRPAVELGEDVAGEPHRACEDPVGAARADELLTVHLLGLTGEQT